MQTGRLCIPSQLPSRRNSFLMVLMPGEKHTLCLLAIVYPLVQSSTAHMLRQIRTDGQKTAVFIFILSLTAVTERGRTFGCWIGRLNNLYYCDRLIGSPGYSLPPRSPPRSSQHYRLRQHELECAGASVTEYQRGLSLYHSQAAVDQKTMTHRDTLRQPDYLQRHWKNQHILGEQSVI